MRRLFRALWRFGWIAAAAGAVFATVLGAMVAGTFVFPVIGTVVAPLALVAIGLDEIWLGLVWAISMSALHVILLKSKD